MNIIDADNHMSDNHEVKAEMDDIDDEIQIEEIHLDEPESPNSSILNNYSSNHSGMIKRINSIYMNSFKNYLLPRRTR